MEVWHKCTTACNKVNDLTRQQIGFYRRNTVSFYAFNSIQRLHQFIKGFLMPATAIRTFSKISEIDTGQNNLADTFTSQFANLSYNIQHGITPAFASCKGNGTE